MTNIVKILGTLQDGGYPQPGCKLSCCNEKNVKNKYVSCLSIINYTKNKFWLIDITPDFRHQIHLVDNINGIIPNGIFITHAHSGHYMGLLELGKEVMNTKELPVYVMKKMKLFLEQNDPWKQLIKQCNIKIIEMEHNMPIILDKDILIKPFIVPHRSEISETVGFNIKSSNISIIYIPDIDSWEAWEVDLIDLINKNDVLFLDGTFFNKNELKNRKIEEIPHPLIIDTMEKLNDIKFSDRLKIYFIHLNHTNNVLRPKTIEYRAVIDNGFNIASEGLEFLL